MNEWDSEWQQVTMSGSANSNEWHRVVQRVTKNDPPCWIKCWSAVCSSEIQNIFCKFYPLEIKIAFKILTCRESLAPGPGSQFVFTVPGPQFVFISPVPKFVFTGPGPQFVFISLGPKFLLTSSGPQLVLTDPDRNFAFTGRGPWIVFNNSGPGYSPQFVFTSPGQDFTATTRATSIIKLLLLPPPLLLQLLRIKWPLKGIWWKSPVLF